MYFLVCINSKRIKRGRVFELFGHNLKVEKHNKVGETKRNNEMAKSNRRETIKLEQLSSLSSKRRLLVAE